MFQQQLHCLTHLWLFCILKQRQLKKANIKTQFCLYWSLKTTRAFRIKPTCRMSFVPISSNILFATGYTFCSILCNKSAIFWPLAHKPMQRTPSTENNITQRHKNGCDPYICVTIMHRLCPALCVKVGGLFKKKCPTRAHHSQPPIHSWDQECF